MIDGARIWVQHTLLLLLNRNDLPVIHMPFQLITDSSLKNENCHYLLTQTCVTFIVRKEAAEIFCYKQHLLCSTEQKKSYGFVTTWRTVNDDRILITAVRKSLVIIANAVFLRVFLTYWVCWNWQHFPRMPPSNLIWQPSHNALQKPIPHCTHADWMSDSISNISAQSTLHYRHVKRATSRTLHKETRAHKLLYSGLSLFSICLRIYNAKWQTCWLFPLCFRCFVQNVIFLKRRKVSI